MKVDLYITRWLLVLFLNITMVLNLQADSNTTDPFDTLYNSQQFTTFRSDMSKLATVLSVTDEEMKSIIHTLYNKYDDFVDYVENNSSLNYDTLRGYFDSTFDQYSSLTITQNLTLQQKTPIIFHRDIILKVANMMWLDIHNKLPYHLTDIDAAKDIPLLYRSDVDTFPDFSTSDQISSEYKTFFKNGVYFVAENSALNNNESITPFYHHLLMPIALKIINGSTSQQDAIKKLVVWVENNYFHSYEDNSTTPAENWGTGEYDKYIKVDGQYYDVINVFKERVGGCHLAARFLKALSTSVNIPALAGELKDNNDVDENGISIHNENLHGATYFPTFDKIVHGDFLADHFGVDADKILLSVADFGNQMASNDINWDYTKHWRKVKNETSNELSLKRSGNKLYLDGYFIALNSDYNTTKNKIFNDYGFDFNCSVLDGNTTYTKCISIKNMIPIKSYFEILGVQDSNLTRQITHNVNANNSRFYLETNATAKKASSEDGAHFRCVIEVRDDTNSTLSDKYIGLTLLPFDEQKDWVAPIKNGVVDMANKVTSMAYAVAKTDANGLAKIELDLHELGTHGVWVSVDGVEFSDSLSLVVQEADTSISATISGINTADKIATTNTYGATATSYVTVGGDIDSFSYRFDSEDYVDSNGSTISLTSLSDGNHTLSVKGIKNNQTQMIPTTLYFTVDNTPPPIPTLTQPSSEGFSSTQTVNITVPVNSTVYYTTDGTTPTTNSISVTSDTVEEITNTTMIKAFSMDEVGNKSDIVSKQYIKNINQTTSNTTTILEDGSKKQVVEVIAKDGKKVDIEVITKIENAITTIDEQGATTTVASVVNDSGETVATRVKVNQNGTVENKFTIGENSSNVKVAIIGADTTVNKDGSMQTIAMYKNNGVDAKAVVKVKVDGTLNNKVEFKTQTGKKAVSKIEVEVAGADTFIKKDGSMQTIAEVSLDEGATTKVTVEVKPNGTSSNKIEIVTIDGKSINTHINSIIKGTSSKINLNGLVVVTTPKISTNDGKTVAVELVAEPTGEVQPKVTVDDEIVELPKFKAGSVVNVKQKSGKVIVEVKTQLSESVTFNN